MKSNIFQIAIASVLLVGCATTQVGESPTKVSVFYATTRKIVNPGVPGRDNLDKSFGNVESTMPETDEINLRNTPRLGEATVSVPEHSQSRLIGSEVDVHIVAYHPGLFTDPNYTGMASTAFYERIGSLVNRKHPVVVYVHGYNNDFQAAAHRAAVFARDLQPVVSKTAVIYSWPSASTLFGPIADYPGDEESSLLDQQSFRGFLDLIHKEAFDPKSVSPVILIGHSLGCRMLTYGLRDLWELHLKDNRNGPPSKMFSQLVLIEPDVNEVYFCQNIVPIMQLCNHVTIYLNGHDNALRLSDYLHNHQLRLGQKGVKYLTRFNQIDVVDASAVASGFLQHSYDNAAFFADLRLLAKGIPAEQRMGVTLSKSTELDGTYSFVKR